MLLGFDCFCSFKKIKKIVLYCYVQHSVTPFTRCDENAIMHTKYVYHSVCINRHRGENAEIDETDLELPYFNLRAYFPNQIALGRRGYDRFDATES